MILAFVLLSKASAPKGEEILRNFSLFAGPEERIQMREDDNAMLEFEVTPAGSAFVAMMPFPVPNEEADDAVRFSISALGSGWKLPAHEAHLVVSLRDVESQPVAVSLSSFT